MLAAWFRLAYAGVFLVAISQLAGVVPLSGDASQALSHIEAFGNIWNAEPDSLRRSPGAPGLPGLPIEFRAQAHRHPARRTCCRARLPRRQPWHHIGPGLLGKPQSVHLRGRSGAHLLVADQGTTGRRESPSSGIDLLRPSKIRSSPNSNSSAEVIAGLEDVLGRKLDEVGVSTRRSAADRSGDRGDGPRVR